MIGTTKRINVVFLQVLLVTYIAASHSSALASQPGYDWFATDATGYHNSAQVAADNFCLTEVQSWYGTAITVWYAEPGLDSSLEAPLPETYTFDCHGFHNGTNAPIIFSSTQGLDSTKCPFGLKPSTQGKCKGEKSNGKPQVCVSSPFNLADDGMYQQESDYRSGLPGGLAFQRYYNSGSEYRFDLGQGWSHSFSRYLSFDSVTAPTSIVVIRQHGRSYEFIKSGAEWISDPDVTGRLEATGSGWIYTGKNDVEEEYDSRGVLQLIRDRFGNTQTLTYSEQGFLERVETNTGVSIIIGYNAKNKISSITDQAGRTWGYRYDSKNRLEYVDNPDGTSRQYHYEDSSSQYALTGITNENGNRYATWSYDSQGRAISSEHAGGVDRTTLTYNTDGTTTVTNPLGKQTTYHFTTIHGVKKVTQVEGHPTASCEGANKSYTYDANGFLSSKTDWNGNTTTYVRDARGLELSRTEASGTPDTRTTTTEWHPDYRLPTRITEPNRIISYVYDEHGRPLSRNIQSVQ